MALNHIVKPDNTDTSLCGAEIESRGCRMDEGISPKNASGRSAAFEAMWRSHAERILRITRRITNNREDAEDALQDSFVRAYIHWHSFDGRSSLATWLTRIAINSALSILRKRASTSQLSLDEDGDPTTGLRIVGDMEHGPSPEAQYSRAEQRAVLRKGIRTLRPAARRALELQVLEDLSVKETAEKMGLSVSATKSRIFQAKAALGKSLERKFVRRSRATGQFQLSPA